MMRRGRGGLDAGTPDRPSRRLERGDVRVFRRLLVYTRPYLGRLTLAAISLFVSSLMSLVFPWIVRNLVDSVFVHHDEHALNLITLSLFAVFLFQAGFNFTQNYLSGWVGERIIADLRRALFAHLQSLSQGFYADHRTGELMSRVTNDV